MTLKLQKPVVFYDLETTGKSHSSRIVSISVIKLHPDGMKEAKSTLINPTIPIPAETSEIHGITDEHVKNSPKFSQLAKALHDFFNNCDVCGYNNNMFDNVILSEEFARCNLDFPNINTKSIDACIIFKKFEKRDLAAAYKYYCNKDLMDAHTSDSDTKATFHIFLAQMKRHTELQSMTIDELHDFCRNTDTVDLAGKIRKDENGDYVYNFGQHKDKKVKDHAQYAEWMLTQDFTFNTKSVLRTILSEKNPTKDNPF